MTTVQASEITDKKEILEKFVVGENKILMVRRFRDATKDRDYHHNDSRWQPTDTDKAALSVGGAFAAIEAFYYEDQRPMPLMRYSWRQGYGAIIVESIEGAEHWRDHFEIVAVTPYK